MMAVAPERNGAGDDLADMHGRFVDASGPHRLVRDQHVLGVEEQDPHLLDRLMSHRRLEIVTERVPTRQNGPAFNAGLKQAERTRFRDLQCADDAVAQAFAAKGVGIRGEQIADPAKSGNQPPGLGLRIATGNRQREQIFDQLMIEERPAAAFEQALAKAGTVP
jgi:hypothetical protein